MRLSIKNYLNILFILSFFTVFFSQITYQSGIRVSVPFRYMEIIFFSIMILQILSYKKDFLLNYKIKLFTFLLFIYFFIITSITTLSNYNTIITGILYPAISIYIFLHTVVLLFLITLVKTNKKIEFNKVLAKLLYLHLVISLFLYITHLIGLNNIMLGVNYHSINIPRAMGLVAEPSHYSILAWITFFYFFNLKKNSLITYISLVAFLISFSTTGIIFALLTIIISIVLKPGKMFLVWLFLLGALFFLIPGEYLHRYYIRINSELFFLWSYIIEGNSIEFIAEGQNSRAINIAHQIQLIINNWEHIIFGLGGSGSQVLLSGNLGNSFKGILYVLAEYGVIGIIFILYIIVDLYIKTSNSIKPLFLAYFIISFFNPSGGNFGLDWLFTLFIIYLLSFSNTKILHKKKNEK
jgi:hypothetical protein